MKTTWVFIFLSTFSTVFCQTSNQSENHSIFESKILGESVAYDLRFPENWEKHKDSLELLVLLDGDEYAGIANNTALLYEFGKKMRPTVVLSLPSTQDSRWKYYTPSKAEADNDGGHVEDYGETGYFSKYADFLAQELLSEIEKQHHIQFTEKTIFGHSMGGLGVLSFMILRPEIFDNYIAASPATMYDNHFIFEQLEAKGQLDFKKLYLTAALDDLNGYRENVEWMGAFLEKNTTKRQTFKVKVYTTENHATSGIRSLIDGMELMGTK